MWPLSLSGLHRSDDSGKAFDDRTILLIASIVFAGILFPTASDD